MFMSFLIAGTLAISAQAAHIAIINNSTPGLIAVSVSILNGDVIEPYTFHWYPGHWEGGVGLTSTGWVRLDRISIIYKGTEVTKSCSGMEVGKMYQTDVDITIHPDKTCTAVIK